MPSVEERVNPKRTRILTSTQTPKPNAQCVLYWMSRDQVISPKQADRAHPCYQRAEDNWALIHARQLASDQRLPLVVLFSLVPRFLSATIRQYGFMIRGLKETAQRLRGELIMVYA